MFLKSARARPRLRCRLTRNLQSELLYRSKTNLASKGNDMKIESSSRKMRFYYSHGMIPRSARTRPLNLQNGLLQGAKKGVTSKVNGMRIAYGCGKIRTYLRVMFLGRARATR